ncbi:hypothetical protein HK100_001669 [Physocladia obscura]|uniref:NADH-cytochrome b5 reductase n=1 Tax=Physocladia obscura TaxID=109957 RepID=A0AAD5SXL3_9FUNG|nr:hypothetical protein HK100_001669 [Physocladia obscura]
MVLLASLGLRTARFGFRRNRLAYPPIQQLRAVSLQTSVSSISNANTNTNVNIMTNKSKKKATFDDNTERWVMRSLVAVTTVVVGLNIYWEIYKDELYPRQLSLEYYNFNKFPLLAVIPVTHDTSLFRFKAARQIPEQEELQKAHAKDRRNLTLTTNELVPAPNHIIIKDDTCQVGRAYTPISYSRDYFDLLVKKYPDGSVSSMIHNLIPGKDFILARGPILSFPYTENMADHIVMIAGGTGITPMYQLIKRILKDSTDKTSISLIYGSKTEADILLGNELQILAQKFPDRLKVNHVVQNISSNELPALTRVAVPADNGGDANKTGLTNLLAHRGLIDEKVLIECGVPRPDENPLVLVCGPDAMVEYLAGEKRAENNQGPLKGVLAKMGYTTQQVFKF